MQQHSLQSESNDSRIQDSAEGQAIEAGASTRELRRAEPESTRDPTTVVAAYVGAAFNGCEQGAIVGLAAGAISGYGALATGAAGCLRGAETGVVGHALEQAKVPGAKFMITAFDWGTSGKDILGAFGQRLGREGFTIGLGFGVEKTASGARFVWGIVIMKG